MSELVVHLDGERCGVVTQSPAGDLSFTYDSAYRLAAGATPLSLSMPLAAATHKKRVVLAFLQGLLPDSDEALNAIGRRYSVSPRNAFSLLTHVGSDVAGAVQVEKVGALSSDAARGRSLVRSVDEREIGVMLRQVVSEYSEGVPFSDPVGHFSLAGAQPKIALHQGPAGNWGVPLDATPTTHILKPVAGTIRRVDIVEQLTMRAAQFLGNTVAQSELQTIDGLNVFVTTRYDRALVGGEWQRLHQEDLCQALSVPPSKKYQHRDGGPGVGAIAELFRSFANDADRRDVGRSFFRAFVFNVVSGGTDAHAKNYSLMLQGERVSLAPLYDLISYAPYWDGRSALNLAMSVAGDYALTKVSASTLISLGKQFGVADEAAEIVDAARRGMVSAFESAIAGLSHTAEVDETIVDDTMRGLTLLPLVIS